ncbi:hypothetical protein BDY21DRAFT_275164, partial [Lineolata rhizophorae]
ASSRHSISKLSDELLIRVLSFVPVATLTVCQRVSRRFYAVAGDSQLWRPAYYERFVAPRLSRQPQLRESAAGGEELHQQHYQATAPVSAAKWLDDAHLVRKGNSTDWKRQYRLRDNWAKGSCGLREISVAEPASLAPLLVALHESVVFTVDHLAGLRAWSTASGAGGGRLLIAQRRLEADKGMRKGLAVPTCLAVDGARKGVEGARVVVGFNDAQFSVFELHCGECTFEHLYTHPAAPGKAVAAVAYCSPYLLLVTACRIMTLYEFFPEEDSIDKSSLAPPAPIHSLQSHWICAPFTLSLRRMAANAVASIAFTTRSLLGTFVVGIQELVLSPSGALLDSRVSYQSDQRHRHQRGHPLTLDDLPPPPVVASSTSAATRSAATAAATATTSLSYSHPYLLAGRPDNTLLLFTVTSTPAALRVSPGTTLWGHTSAVGGAHVGGRGKAVSVSLRGEEMRVWDLEGGLSWGRKAAGGGGGANGRGLLADREREKEREKGVRRRGLDLDVARGYVGFDEEKVVVLKERCDGGQALAVYDFT